MKHDARACTFYAVNANTRSGPSSCTVRCVVSWAVCAAAQANCTDRVCALLAHFTPNPDALAVWLDERNAWFKRNRAMDALRMYMYMQSDLQLGRSPS